MELSIRHKHQISALKSFLKYSISIGGNIKSNSDAFYCISELDLSNKAQLIWKLILSLSFKIVGLADPYLPITITDLYVEYQNAISLNNIDFARTILCATAGLLLHSFKNTMVSQCSLILALDTDGKLREEDWNVKLNSKTQELLAFSRHQLKVSLLQLKMNALPAEGKVMKCLIRSIIEGDEDRIVRSCNLMQLWNMTDMIWTLLDLLCKNDASFTWADKWIENYKRCWTMMKLLSTKVESTRCILFHAVIFINPIRSQKFGNKEYSPRHPTMTHILNVKDTTEFAYNSTKRRSITEYHKKKRNGQYENPINIYNSFTQVTNIISDDYIPNPYYKSILQSMRQKYEMQSNCSVSFSLAKINGNKSTDMGRLAQKPMRYNKDNNLNNMTSQSTFSKSSLIPRSYIWHTFKVKFYQDGIIDFIIYNEPDNRMKEDNIPNSASSSPSPSSPFLFPSSSSSSPSPPELCPSSSIIFGPFPTEEACSMFHQKIKTLYRLRQRLNMNGISYKIYDVNSLYIVSDMELGPSKNYSIPRINTLRTLFGVTKTNFIKECLFHKIFVDSEYYDVMSSYYIYDIGKSTWHSLFDYPVYNASSKRSSDWNETILDLVNSPESIAIVQEWYDILSSQVFIDGYIKMFGFNPISVMNAHINQ